ncbi:hypothetical protein N6H13_10395 [Paenibacillus sp. CC-CFT742]|uniref:hypothetical protein n=1 Tax=Paenibacillus illinoisensis TaxID=59845 RepID=UPI0025756A80|nr:hypothetical protein [Paenibacillus sp. CC-CFT742]WJH30946.1 hypothetical protein N6H13_10395 [Paenibacillus sp. CC-CFT742]
MNLFELSGIVFMVNFHITPLASNNPNATAPLVDDTAARIYQFAPPVEGANETNRELGGISEKVCIQPVWLAAKTTFVLATDGVLAKKPGLARPSIK